MTPPKDVSARELWALLTEMPRPYRVVDFPRKDANGSPIGQVAIRVLLQSEQIRAAVSAERLIRAELPDGKPGESIGYDVGYANASSVEQLWHACRDPENLDRPAFPTPKWMRDHITTDELGVLFNHYLVTTADLGPIIGAMTQAEADAWIERLIEGGNEADQLAFFSSEALRSLVRSGVARLRSSRMARSSVGSPPESTSTASLEVRSASGDAPPDEGL